MAFDDNDSGGNGRGGGGGDGSGSGIPDHEASKRFGLNIGKKSFELMMKAAQNDGLCADCAAEGFAAAAFYYVTQILQMEVLRRDIEGSSGSDGDGEEMTAEQVLEKAKEHSLDHMGRIELMIALAEANAQVGKIMIAFMTTGELRTNLMTIVEGDGGNIDIAGDPRPDRPSNDNGKEDV